MNDAGLRLTNRQAPISEEFFDAGSDVGFQYLPCRGRDHESSGPGEFHPQALADPDGSLATHPALMIQSLVESRSAKGPADSDHAAPRDPASALRRWGDA